MDNDDDVKMTALLLFALGLAPIIGALLGMLLA